ncbi:hypothetical protein KSC_029380 [Ktedonobacter sp. SOSP1-52]|nr:hypothetical protein KSC_029380 [Ktedonobacter sp. SOSP1-52]
MTKALFGTHKLLTQLREILTTEILEFTAFEQVSHLFLWIEFRGIARQSLQVNSFAHRAGEKGFDHFRSVDGQAIPNNEQLARDLAEQYLQKTDDVLCCRGSLLHLHEDPPFLSDTPYGRKMITGQLGP